MLINSLVRVGIAVASVGASCVAIGTGVTAIKRFVFKDQYATDNSKPIVRAIADESAKILLGTATTIVAASMINGCIKQSKKWTEFLFAKQEASKAAAQAANEAVVNMTESVADTSADIVADVAESVRNTVSSVTRASNNNAAFAL